MKQFKIRSIQRPQYTYVVSVDANRVYSIKAGCRHWYSFKHAESHYKVGQWSDQYYHRYVTNIASGLTTIEHFEHWLGARTEAKAILRLLKRKVERYQDQLYEKAMGRGKRKRVIRRKKRT